MLPVVIVLSLLNIKPILFFKLSPLVPGQIHPLPRRIITMMAEAANLYTANTVNGYRFINLSKK